MPRNASDGNSILFMETDAAAFCFWELRDFSKFAANGGSPLV
jgi:hypothetical protein